MPLPSHARICLIAALSEDGVIGTGRGGIPWRLPRDAAHFRASVAGKAILLGRKTYGEMEGWFRDERPIVLTSDPGFHPREGATRIASSLAEALRIGGENGASELMVCGGASVYALALPHAERMILTHVSTRIGESNSNASRFPNFNLQDWRIEREESHPPDAANAFAMRIVWYRKFRALTPR